MRITVLWAVIALCLFATVSVCWGAAEIPICTEQNIQSNPVASGGRVVWVDGRHPDPDLPPTGWDIFMFDIATGVETPLCTVEGDQLFPAIDGDRVVWLDQRTGSWAIYLYDIPSAIERRIADVSTPNIFTTFGPDISGDLVVWADDRYDPTNHKLDVLMYNISTNTLTRITDDAADQGSGGPHVDGMRIVWCDTRGDPAGDIYMYDLSSETESIVSSAAGSEGQPDISGDDVVWTQGVAEGVWNIYHRNLASPDAPAPLEISPATEACPLIAGRWVVWSDYRNGNMATGATEVYVYDLVEHEVRSLTGGNATADFRHAVSSAGLVAWMDWRNGNRSIYENPDIYGYVLNRFSDVLMDYWAYDAIESCVEADIVSGYPEGDYKPNLAVTRDQMAVYIARALAQGDANVPNYTGDPTFPDVGDTFWAFKYIEYSASQGVVTGYTDGTYQPANQVTRDQMAVYVARALVAPSGEVGLADYIPADPRNFPDVPADSWAYRHIEYCVEHGVVQGYSDGQYYPGNVVTRDQMAVYVARAFDL